MSRERDEYEALQQYMRTTFYQTEFTRNELYELRDSMTRITELYQIISMDSIAHGYSYGLSPSDPNSAGYIAGQYGNIYSTYSPKIEQMIANLSPEPPSTPPAGTGGGPGPTTYNTPPPETPPYDWGINPDAGYVIDPDKVLKAGSDTFNIPTSEYIPSVEGGNWMTGGSTTANSSKFGSYLTPGKDPSFITDYQPGTKLTSALYVTYKVPPGGSGVDRRLNAYERENIGNISNLKINDAVLRAYVPTVASTASDELYNTIQSEIQNAYGYPKMVAGRSSEYDREGSTQRESIYRTRAAQYDYKIDLTDHTLSLNSKIEDKLQEIRTVLGINVHGSNYIAKDMKYYTYNRFHIPDTNMAHNKSTTYVFFTRPDLNILLCSGGIASGANKQTKDHSESSMIYRRDPELFKLLTKGNRCGDNNNFNLLLSNQVTSFDIMDESLTTTEAGRSWAGYEMMYGDSFSGRAAGEFACNFAETNRYSIVQLIKLWITYIDNVAKGAWKPSYNLLGGDGVATGSMNDSYVYTKTLDYGAACYVFKCGPDGEDVLYWSKYFGVFPSNTGASALSWEKGPASMGDAPKLNIRFKYSFKKDMSPISLMEFNTDAHLSGSNSSFLPAYNEAVAGSERPFVGVPFIELKLQEPQLVKNGTANAPASIRLKFAPIDGDGHPRSNDELLYRANLIGRS